ncbi:DUF5067 domain-containing protein [Lacticaseibacillus parakribbianus]|uniref:DUF5067 domain-containing protein n=1 Tax=Lacticaseibacillus parakribbianus TaxID=2970927 RepID=UPI0021CB750E|nr:DUF5067 domain-containing protein [Lacticaseibacillus parakribbianus]
MRAWRWINRILAAAVVVLAVVALARLGFTAYAARAIRPQHVAVGRTTTKSAAASEPQLALSGLRYRTGRDFLNRPALVVSYHLRNRGGAAALPSYVLDSTVSFLQQTQTGLTGVLATTTLATGQLSMLARNYAENAGIKLKAGEAVKVIAAYRLESLNLPVTVMINGHQDRILRPWQLKAVTADE